VRTVDVATELEEWAASIVPGLNTFPNQPPQLSQALPIVLCEVRSKRRRKTGEMPRLQYQQTAVRLWVVALMLMVAPEPAWTASQALYGMVDDLEDALVRDPTLGGRVPIAEKDMDASFDPPEVEHADGTVARVATMNLTIGEQVGG
jgi:hypothetical protein